METDLEKFDEFIEKENIDPFKLVEALLNRALARAYTEDYIKNYAEYPKGISDDLAYIQFDNHEIEFFESTYYSDSVTISSKQAFVKKDPDHHLTLKEALRKKEKAEKYNKEREKQQEEVEIQRAIEKLKSTGLSDEQILERIKNGS